MEKESVKIEITNQFSFPVSSFHSRLQDQIPECKTVDFFVVVVVQCRIIRTTELANDQEKLNDLEKQKADILKFYSPISLLHQIQGKLMVIVLKSILESSSLIMIIEL